LLGAAARTNWEPQPETIVGSRGRQQPEPIGSRSLKQLLCATNLKQLLGATVGIILLCATSLKQLEQQSESIAVCNKPETTGATV
jgi:hypothetical protein